MPSCHAEGLTMEMRESPLVGTDVPHPRLGWKIAITAAGQAAGARNQTQSAYQVHVEAGPWSTPGSGAAVLWDSGRVASAETLNVPYGGALLALDADAFWRVRVWDGTGSDCGWSAIATWSAAPRGEADWAPSAWIARSADPPPPATNSCAFYDERPSPLLRTTFAVASGDAARASAPAAAAAAATLVKARLHVAALGYIEVWLDGQRVGDARLDPAWSDVSQRVLFSSYDVTSELRGSSAGEHVLGVSLGNGWWNPLPLLFWGSHNIREALASTGWEPQVRLLLTLYFSDGSKQRVVSTPSPAGSGWRVGASPRLRNNVYLGEQYDARLLDGTEGWSSDPAFNDTAWANAVAAVSNTTDTPLPAAERARAGGARWPPLLGRLRSQSVPPIRVVEQLPARSVAAVPAEQAGSAEVGATNATSVAYVFDLGRNFAGTVNLTLPAGLPAAARGAVIRLRYGEVLYPNGSLNVMTSVAGQIKSGNGGPCAPHVAWQQDLYTVRAAPSESAAMRGESYVPAFTFHGFRYAELTGWPTSAGVPPPTTAALTGLVLHSDVRRVGTFASSSKVLNGVYGMCLNAHTSNMVGIQSDCPARERFGYGGDALASGETALLAWDMAAFYEKRLDDYADAQASLGASGGLTETAPSVGLDDGSLGRGTGPIGWDSFLPLMQLMLYREYGSASMLERMYPATEAWISFLEAAPQAAVQGGLSDWMALEPSAAVAPLTGAGFLYWNLLAWSDINAALGNTTVAAQYAAKAQAAAAALNAEFLPGPGRPGHGPPGVYHSPTARPVDAAPAFNGTQCGQGMPLYLGIVPPDQQGAAVAALVDNIESRWKGHLAFGMFGAKYALMALSDAGRNDVAVRMATQEAYPGYGYMLAQGATTLWESWNYSPNVYSHNHAMFSSVATWMPRSLCGLRNDASSLRASLSRASRVGAAGAYASFGVRPAPAEGLSWVNCTFDSPRGRIEVRWTLAPVEAADSRGARGAGTAPFSFNLTVAVPPNTQAHVTMPGSAPEAATVVGSGAWTFHDVVTLPSVRVRAET